MGYKAVKATEAEEEMFLKSKESMQEISGWKVLIFLPNDPSWKTLVVGVISISTFCTLTGLFYDKQEYVFQLFNGFGDLLYLTDTVCATLHYTMRKTRGLRFGRKRPFLFLVLDYLSLLPLEDIWLKCRFCDEYCRRRGFAFLSLLVVIRFYQVPIYFDYLKNGAFTVKGYLYITIVEVILYYFIITHTLSCFLFLQFDEVRKELCREKFLFCTTENFIVSFFLLGHHYAEPFSGYPLLDKKLLIIFNFLLGYIFTLGFVVPVFMFSNLKKLIFHSKVSYNLSRAKILTGFGKDDKKLEKDICDYLRHLNNFGVGEEQQDLLRYFPTALKKSICCDLHWEAMRHSVILEDLSMGCKRSLAIFMTSRFVLPNTILFEKNKGPTSFLYLDSGLLHVLAEESSVSSVLSLSGGTVLGEISFFCHKISPATIKVAKFSVIHSLRIRDFFLVLRDYPNDKKKILEKLKTRIEFAKKLAFIKSQRTDKSLFELPHTLDELKKGNIKWLKKQYREVSSLRKAEELMLIDRTNQLFVDDYQRQLRNLETNIKHTSLFMKLLSISEETENVGRVCLKDLFCAMDPDCYFLKFWEYCVFCTCTFATLLYPGVIGWIPFIPMWFYIISVIVSIIFELDLAFQFVTVIRTKNYIIKKFSSIFIYRILHLSFYIDCLAAVPLQIFFYNPEKRFYSNCYFSIALLKVCKILPQLRWITTEEKKVSYRIFMNYMILLFILTYWGSAVFNITGVECILYTCGPGDWFMRETAGLQVNRVFPPILRAVKLAFELSTHIESTNVLNSFIVILCMFLIFFIYNIQMRAGCSAAFIKDLSTYFGFRNRMESLYNFMTRHDLTGNIRFRAVSMMQFQWDIEGGITNAQKQEMYNILQENLKHEIDLKLKLPTLLKCKLFRDEEQKFLLDICRRACRLYLPANSVLVTFGTQTRCLYIVEKGFVQINSFLVADLHLNTSKRLTAKAGDAFPVIDVLTQTPSAISAVTMTDCKILLLDLEDVLTFMMIHGVFKDVVLTVKDTDLAALKSVKLAVSEFKDEFKESIAYRKEVFKRISFLGPLLGLILKKNAINSHGNRYLIWETTRLVFQMISFAVWPVAMNVLNIRKRRMIFSYLLAFEIFPFIDFYVRMNVAYYNRKGIYITNTCYTFRHYLTTSFVLDFISFSPNFCILYLITLETHKISVSCYLSHIILRSAGLYRYIGYLLYIRSRSHQFFNLYCALLCFLIFIVFHHLMLFVVFLIERGILKSRIILTVEKTVLIYPYQHYFHGWAVALTLILKNIFQLKNHDILSVMNILTGSVVGLLIQIVLYSYLAVKVTVSKKSIMSYRYFLNSFVIFLVNQKAEESLIKHVVDYFEFRWRKLNGVFIEKLVLGLPESVQEDILLPLYKETLSGICCFWNANDYFYRLLSRKVEKVVLMENSTVIFKKEAQVYIYFLDKGHCMVENSPTVLVKGAVIGDIKRKGVMTNTITTKADVILLKISSRDFFQILNDFYMVKRKYEAVVESAEDFIPSDFKIEVQAMSRISSKVVEKEYLESEFVDVMTDRSSNKSLEVKKKRFKCSLTLNSKVVEFLSFIFLIVAYITVLIIPFFLMTRLVTRWMLFTIYALDFLWLVKIITSFVVKTRGKVVVKNQSKLSKYTRLVIRIIYNSLSVLPIEIIPFLHYNRIDTSQHNCYVFCMFYINRFLRIFHVFHYFQIQYSRVLISVNFNIFEILLLQIAFISIMSAIRLQFRHGIFTAKKCFTSLNSAQKEELLENYLCLANVFVRGTLEICLPKTNGETFFQLFVSFWSFISKAYFGNYVLVMIYLKQYNNTVQKAKFHRIQEYLKVRNISSILLVKCQSYFRNSLIMYHDVGEPKCLKTAPSCLKIRIMQELYMSNLLQCDLFQKVDEVFLKQLAARLIVQVYFPGDYITEKGDVDHNMYFIKKGEVYCVENDKTYTALETATNILRAGDTFGLPQGILSALPHSRTYRSKTSCTILVLNNSAWEDLRLAFPDTANHIYGRCAEELKIL